jgi:hypothetical protein
LHQLYGTFIVENPRFEAAVDVHQTDKSPANDGQEHRYDLSMDDYEADQAPVEVTHYHGVD